VKYRFREFYFRKIR